MHRLAFAPVVIVLALLLVTLVSLSQHGAVRAEPVVTPTVRLPGITPTAASAGLLNLVPTLTPTPIPAIAVPNVVYPTPAPSAPRFVPTATPVPPSVCSLTGPEYRQAGEQTIVIGAIAGALPGQEGGFVFDLPAGDYLVARILRNNTTTVQVCYLWDGSSLTLARTNGAEISRAPRSPDANGAFDYIVASVRPPECLFECGPVSSQPGAVSAPVNLVPAVAIVPLETAGVPRLRPPDTGDAGMAGGG